MILIVNIMGVVMSLVGLTFLFKPSLMKKFVSFMKGTKKIYMIGILRLALGVIFIIAAPQANYAPVIMAIGILMVSSGILVFGLGLKRATAIMEWFLKMPDSNARLIAIVPILLGVLILFSA